MIGKRLNPAVTAAMGLAALIGFAETASLSIPAEIPYREVVFPNAVYPAGLRPPAIPADWSQLSLDGAWKLKVIATPEKDENVIGAEELKTDCLKPDADLKDWVDKQVPNSWYATDPGQPQKTDFVSGKIGWYRRNFALEDSQLPPKKRVVLDFRRVADQVDVWVNGKKIGARASGRFNSVQFDITDAVVKGENVLAARVYDYVGHKNYWRRHIGGLYEPVRLLFIPSKVYADRVMVTSKIADNAIAVRARIANPTGAKGGLKLTAVISDPKSGKETCRQALPPVNLKDGAEWYDLGEIKLKDPTAWTPENPQLYNLSLIDADGHSVAMERFGFREFTAAGEWLYLNGKKFKPRMYTFTAYTGKSYCLMNADQMMEKTIRLLKEANVNMLRPHSGDGALPETFFMLCDEIGMPIYIDWSGLGYMKMENIGDPAIDNVDAMWRPLRAFLEDYYSHPSFCMLSFRNELYEGHDHGTGTPQYFCGKLDALYGLTKAFDRQNRPVCASTGRQTLEALLAGSLKERTDILDDHQYRGAYSGSWQENIAHINNYAAIAAKNYGAKPKIDAEYGVPGDCLRYRDVTFTNLWPAFQLDPNSPEFKIKYIEFLRSPTPEIGIYLRLKMNWCSPRQYLTENECRHRYAYNHFKRPVEIYRRAGVKCLGGHTNAQLYDFIALADPGLKGKYGIPSPFDANKGKWVAMPLLFELKRLYNPTLVTAEAFNEHPVAGSKQSLSAVVTNDLNETAEFKVIPRLRLGDDILNVLPPLDFGKIAGMEQKALTLRYDVPAFEGVKRGRLELYLFRNGERVGDNFYDLTVADVGKVAAPDKKIAVYDSAAEIFRGLTDKTTSDALKKLGLKFDTVKDFAALDDYRLLIVGANSFDKTLLDASEKLNLWLKNGGRLLCFEQSLCGRIPFLPNYSVTAGSSATFVTLSVPKHPAFKDLSQDDFDSWSGHMGYMYDYALSPLDAGLVAVAPSGSHNDVDNVKSVLCDVKIGKGHATLSQMAATKRFGDDAVATRYLRNLIGYFASDSSSKFAAEIPDAGFAKAVYVEDKDAFFVDLSKVVNQGFDDEKINDGKGGWADFGTGFKEIPTGITRLQGGVPFKIVDAAKHDGKGCLVLKSRKRPNFPEKVTNIPINELLNSVYFLHTAMYAGKGPVLKYAFHYENGETREFVAGNENDIPDWWFPKDKVNATVVFRVDSRGLYMSEFVNPIPKVKITSMDIIGCDNATPFVIAITGRKRFSSVVSGVGEQ